ncbi:hypothetical protein J7E83_20955 [Arthrobacter sp. ISL-48]|uniref:hypothetical protein n=1 Tax=Arthrobacter sp. ISL-48 TaxID=2819110 RepID=UPI001BED259B|nr:hypothetical protein [Arthrobacter sp. ISL-48]MBT2534552.1 hypothetical protein [Arthrobacter sp. ISL-48]
MPGQVASAARSTGVVPNSGKPSDLLPRLGLGQIPLTQEVFHDLQPWRTAAHLEELMASCGILPAPDTYLCLFERWLAGHNVLSVGIFPAISYRE